VATYQELIKSNNPLLLHLQPLFVDCSYYIKEMY